MHKELNTICSLINAGYIKTEKYLILYRITKHTRPILNKIRASGYIKSYSLYNNTIQINLQYSRSVPASRGFTVQIKAVRSYNKALFKIKHKSFQSDTKIISTNKGLLLNLDAVALGVGGKKLMVLI